jgi:hypothetical protein
VNGIVDVALNAFFLANISVLVISRRHSQFDEETTAIKVECTFRECLQAIKAVVRIEALD